MGGNFSKKGSNNVKTGFYFRLKSIFKNSQSQRERLRIKKKSLWFIIQSGKLGIIFFLCFFVKLKLNNELNQLDPKYENLIIQLEAIKSNSFKKLKDIYENFYQKALLKNSLSLNIQNEFYVEVSENDKSYMFYMESLNHILTSNNIPNTDLRLKLIKNVNLKYLNKQLEEYIFHDVDQVYFGFSIYGGNIGLLENLIYLKNNAGELFFILSINITYAFVVNFAKKIRNFYIDYLIKIIMIDKREKNYLEEIEMLVKEFEQENFIIYNSLIPTIFSTKEFKQMHKDTKADLIKFNLEVLTEIINKSFEFYVKAGFDPNDLINFSFDKMPLNSLSQDKDDLLIEEMKSKLKKILKKNIINHQKNNPNFTKSEKAFNMEKKLNELSYNEERKLPYDL